MQLSSRSERSEQLETSQSPLAGDFNSWPAPTASQLQRIVTALSGGAL